MTTVTAQQQEQAPETTEHVDVLIVGAGMSGIGAAHHLQEALPGTSYAILEAREAIGGTWDLFRYPGIRSDSDLHTYGFAFEPWTDEKSIADGPSILRYIRATASRYGIDRNIRFGHRATAAQWSGADARWTVTATRSDGAPVTLTCAWLFAASGYYRYDQGYLPHFEGAERFQGVTVHPQQWPADLDYAGKRVVVIGSGATAVTLVPAMTDRAAHVTMLQRSPTYVVTLPERDPIANLLKRVLPAQRAYALTRRKNVWLQRTVYRLSRRRPALVKRLIRYGLERQLPADYDIDRHFTPAYEPWDQRLCAVPDGDLFRAISEGTASVVTDQIDTFTEHGIRLASGRELAADVVVTATGLDLLAFGGMSLTVDGAEVDLAEGLVYKGAMLNDVPNFAFAMGYTNSSWTLKVDLVADWLCRVIAYQRRSGTAVCVPVNDDPSMPTRPLLDFGAGYVQRAVHRFPRQGANEPWTTSMSYAEDLERMRDAPVVDGVLRFTRAPAVPMGSPGLEPGTSCL